MIRTGIIVKAKVSRIEAGMPVLYNGIPAQITADRKGIQFSLWPNVLALDQALFDKMSYLAVASPVSVEMLDSRDETIYFNHFTCDFRKNIPFCAKHWSNILRFNLIGAEVEFVTDYYARSLCRRDAPEAHLVAHGGKVYSEKEVKQLLNWAHRLGVNNKPAPGLREWQSGEL